MTEPELRAFLERHPDRCYVSIYVAGEDAAPISRRFATEAEARDWAAEQAAGLPIAWHEYE